MTTENLEDRLAAAENAMADAREERDEADAHAGELQTRLDRIVSFLAVKHDVQGHSAAWAATVVRIALGEDAELEFCLNAVTQTFGPADWRRYEAVAYILQLLAYRNHERAEHLRALDETRKKPAP